MRRLVCDDVYQHPGVPQYGVGPYRHQRRSAIPLVIGILMIVFASLALLFQLVGYLLAMDSLSRLNTAVFVLQVIGLPITCVQLLAGIACVRYRRFGPQLALCYATISLLHTMVMAATIAATTKGDLRPGYFVVNVIYLAWPIVAGVLITRPSSKAACSS